MIVERCKENVLINRHIYQCKNKATKDGYCGIHHPDAVKKRKKKSEDRYHLELERRAFHYTMLFIKEYATEANLDDLLKIIKEQKDKK